MFRPKPKETYDLPVLERIYNQFTGEESRPYGRHNPLPEGTRIGEMYGKDAYPSINAKIENISQRVNKEWRGNEMALYSIGDPEKIVHDLHDGREEIEQNMRSYLNSGILKYTPSTMDEAYFQASAKLLVHMAKQKAKDEQNQDGQGGPGQDGAIGHSDYDDTIDAKDKSEFIEYIQSMRWWFDIVNENMKKLTFDDAQESKVELIPDDDGDVVQLTDLELSKLSRATSDFYLNMAGDPTMFVLGLEESSMTQRYRKVTYKYIEILVIDESSSMQSQDAIIKAASYIYNRLDRVKKDISMCAIVGFTNNAYTKQYPSNMRIDDEPMWLIDTYEKAHWMQQQVIDQYVRNFHGGGTDIPAGLYKAYDLSLEMEKYNGIRPTVTVLTDDDGSAYHTEYSKIPGLKINAMGFRNNEYMRDAALKTGGKYYSVEDIDISVEGKI